MLSSIGSVLLALFVLGVLIFFHELGHFSVGRLFKFPINEFAIGFGPKILKKEKGGIIYSLRALPFGGFVAYESELEEDTGYMTFDRKPLWQRFLVIMAGPMANFIIAYLISVILLAFIGIPLTSTTILSVTADSPAFEAGLLADDRIIAIDDTQLNDEVEILFNTMSSLSQDKVYITVDREGIINRLLCNTYIDENTGNRMIGITLKQLPKRYGFGESLTLSFKWVIDQAKQLLGFFGRLITKGEGAGDVSGIVGAVAIMSETVQESGIAAFLGLVIFISINFCVFNLIPFPGLDGSKILFMGIEIIIRHPIKAEKQGIVQAIGFGIIIILFLVLTYKDIMMLLAG